MGMNRVPVDLRAPEPQPTEGLKHRARIRARTADMRKRWHRHHLSAPLPGKRTERMTGAGFEQHAPIARQQLTDAFRKEHAPPQMASPVLRIGGLRRANPGPGDIRDKRYPRRPQ